MPGDLNAAKDLAHAAIAAIGQPRHNPYAAERSRYLVNPCGCYQTFDTDARRWRTLWRCFDHAYPDSEPQPVAERDGGIYGDPAHINREGS